MKPTAKSPKARRRATSSAADARPAKVNLAAIQAFAATHLPGATVAEKFGNASFSVTGKVFAFTRPNGIVLKLPPEALGNLLATRDAQPLVMGKRVMREWAHLHLATLASLRDELPLLKAAMDYVQPPARL